MKPSDLSDRFLASAFPFASATAVVFLALDCAPSLALPGISFWIPLALSCLLPVIISAAFGIKEGNTSAMVRALVFALLALRGIQIALITRPWEVRIIPKIGDILTLIASGICWVWSASIDSLLAGRAIVLASVEGKTGDDLYSGLREEGLMISSSNGDLERVRDFCTLYPALLIGALAAITLTGHVITRNSILAVAAIFVLAGFLRAILQVYRSELYWAGLGLAEAFTLTRKRLAGALAILVLCALVMLVVSGEKPILPATAFLALLAWLKAFFAPDPNAKPFEFPRKEVTEQNGFEDYLKQLVAQQDSTPNIAWLWTALGYILTALVIGSVIWFLFGPLIRREAFAFFSSGKTRARLKAFLANLRALGSSLLAFFAELRYLFPGARTRGIRGSTQVEVSKKSFSEAIKELIHPGLSKEKKKEIGKLTQEFLKLIAWGAEQGVECRASTGPLEYVRALATARVLSTAHAPAGVQTDTPPVAQTQQAEQAILDIGVLFEKALYSKDLLERGEEDRFIREIAETVAPAKTQTGAEDQA